MGDEGDGKGPGRAPGRESTRKVHNLNQPVYVKELNMRGLVFTILDKR